MTTQAPEVHLDTAPGPRGHRADPCLPWYGRPLPRRVGRATDLRDDPREHRRPPSCREKRDPATETAGRTA